MKETLIGILLGAVCTYILLKRTGAKKDPDWESIADGLYRAACGHDRPMKAINNYLKHKK